MGRQLDTITKSDGTSIKYRYNSDGIRISKVVDGTTTYFTVIDGRITSQTQGTDKWYFRYDRDNELIGFEFNNAQYYYVKNIQKDIIGILDSNGNCVVQYEYNPWGSISSITGSMASTLGKINPFRYRSYYYDNETGLYYVSSRYYDPETCRFINADGVMGVNGDMASYNLYAYCGNDPVNRYDDDGMSWKSIWNKVKSVVRTTLHVGNTLAVAVGIDTARIGAFFLNMSKDSNGVYHASFDCWQQYFGYNKGYDFIFDIGTSMKAATFDFSYGGRSYRLWAWKGDYINLGAGAELGIYYYGAAGHWLVDKGQAMNISMTLKYNGSTIISYSAKKWWLTGFNPRYLNKSASSLTVTFIVTFNSRGMYDAFMGRNSKYWKPAGGLSASYTF